MIIGRVLGAALAGSWRLTAVVVGVAAGLRTAVLSAGNGQPARAGGRGRRDPPAGGAVTGPAGGAVEASARALPRWRWRRPDPEDPFPLYAATVPGVLGVDGATVELTRSGTLRAYCPVCARRSRMWSATLRLPAPWGAAGAYRGCTRAHAVALIPRDWSRVAEGYALAAVAVAAEGRTSAWHRHQIALYRDQSARAAWLHDHPVAWRTLALALWAGNDLGVDETAAIVAAVMAEPPIGPSSPPATPVDAAAAG